MAFGTGGFGSFSTEPDNQDPFVQNPDTTGGQPAPAAGGCDCANIAYEYGSKCYKQCSGGGNNPHSGACPPGTPAGPAACCPSGTVWRDDDQKCEAPDARQQRGEDTCRNVDVTCPDNYAPWCDFDSATVKCAYCPGCENAAGPKKAKTAGGGGGGGGQQYQAPSDPAAGQAQVIWQQILARLNGGSRYTPEVMQQLSSQSKSDQEAQASRLTEQSNADLASRGILRSGIAAAAQRGIRADVSTAAMGNNTQILKAKIDADYQDKTQAISEGMNWLNSLRDYVARVSATKAQYDVGMSNITLGYARLQQELETMREQYLQQVNLLVLGRNLPQA